MGRQATKAVGNAYYEARMRAGERDERLLSRAGAAEQLHVSVDVVTDAELDLYKSMPVDLVVRMADLYRAPELLNHFCIEQCPIGPHRAISEKVLPVERVTVKLLKKLRVDQIDNIRERLVDIAEDGKITKDEESDMKEINDYLHSLSKTISELELIVKKIVGH